jgi:uncharacterized membrane protein
VRSAVPRPRIGAIDALRGLVIVLMVVDHARDYSAGSGRLSDPMNLDTVSPLLFWMRWAAHFCAPTFTLLAGVSAGLQTATATSPGAIARHLALRGAILVLLEFTLVHFAWTFSVVWPMFYAQVIWGLGVSMLVLAAHQYVPRRVRLTIGIACVALHNLLDGWHPTSPEALHWLWAILHDRQVMPLWDVWRVRTSYPVLPMIGLMLVGEALGHWYHRVTDHDTRRRWLTRAGVSVCLLFVLLRVTNLYGDPHVAVYGGGLWRDLLALLNTTKYPMSLSFMAMTLGPALVLLGVWDRAVPRLLAPVVHIGQVPMFFYVAHLYTLHAVAIGWALLSGFSWTDFDFRATITGIPATFGFPLWVTLPFAAGVVVLLYPAARWYGRLRASGRVRWTRYF